jgi:ankyrin repeat protein
LIDAAFDSLEALREALRAEPELLEERTGLGETPLHFLTVENQLDAVAVLVDAGAQVNTINSCGGTPLSEAASLGYVEMVNFLLSRGASLVIEGQQEPVLHEAVRGGRSELVEAAIAAGARLDEQNDLEETALHLAAEADDRLPILKLLLDAGANASIRRIFDETPLDVAIRCGSAACTAALVAYGAPKGGGNAAA